jgi:hypothetical protein
VKFRFPLGVALLLPLSSFAAGAPENLGLGLKQLVENYQTDRAQFRAKISDAKTVQADTADRVMVNIHLDGTKRLEEIATTLKGLGLEIIAVDSAWRGGVISAWLPISQATAVAELAGVRSVMLAPPPRKRVGSVTAESSVVEHAQQVNTPGLYTAPGIRGSGITIGIVSDSYDTASGATRASAGVSSGNLPGPGNPDGYTTPVVVLDDGTSGDTDEGRGMAEIVHDIAPAAKICFSESGGSQTSMANSIRNLRTNGQALCDIIADDIYFTDEPFFSDGPISRAIDDVVTSNVLAGKKVVYFSAAGNESNYGYSSDVHLVTIAQGKAAVDNLQFTANSPPPALYAGGFHNLNPGGATTIAMSVKTDASGSPSVALQWDDPFDTGGVTTDYNLLVFNASGAYVGAVSGTDNNFNTSEPLELVDLAANTTYQFVISLASSAPPTATHLHLSSTTGESLSGPYIAYNATNMFGHTTAANANAVGAYVYNVGPDTIASYNSGETNPPPGPYRPALEDFSSTGGSLAFYFDASGNRLANPVIRQKPEFSAADGVDTSFFPSGSGNDYDNDNFPNFFGTSAAAPTAAAIGALILDAAGGPGSRTPDQIRSIMQQTTFPHDLDPNVCQAIAANSTATVQVTANGNASNDSANSSSFFTVAFTGNSGQTLNQLVIDLTNTPLVFDESSNGFPFTVSSNPGGVSISKSLSADERILTLSFGNTFTPGKTISFGIDRDLSAISAGGNLADLLAGADITATINSSTTLLGAFANQLGAGFTFADGYGLVNAQKAVESVLGPLPQSTSVAGNLSTRGLVQIDDNVMIGGFIAQGAAAKKVIIRARGPSLTGAGVSGAMADPTIELHDHDGNLIAFNDNWRDTQETETQATGLAPSNDAESAIVVQALAAGNYTAIVRGSNSSTGIALFEVYDLDSNPPPSQLANLSTRGPVQTGDDVMIGGFIVTGSTPTNVLVRAIGPSLTAFGLTNALADPLIELHDGQGNLILANDNWQQDSLQATQIQATGLAPGNALESAIFTNLSAGNYTAIVRGANATTGVGLVEVFNLK